MNQCPIILELIPKEGKLRSKSGNTDLHFAFQSLQNRLSVFGQTNTIRNMSNFFSFQFSSQRQNDDMSAIDWSNLSQSAYHL